MRSRAGEVRAIALGLQMGQLIISHLSNRGPLLTPNNHPLGSFFHKARYTSMPYDDGFVPWSESLWQICFSHVLGSGAYSTVYRGLHRFQGHLTAAIKVLGKSTTGNEMENLRQEVNTLKHLSSGNRGTFFPRLLGAYEDSSNVYVVMEEARGVTLASIIQEVPESVPPDNHHCSSSCLNQAARKADEACAPSSEERTAWIMHKLSEALVLLHRSGLLHRDIKPRNLIVDRESDSLTLVDFGLAVVINKESRFTSCSTVDSSVETLEEREIVGSFNYIAPEVLSHQEYSTAVDMWAAGVIAYLMISGHYPFRDDEEIIRSVAGPSFSGSRWDRVSDKAKGCIQSLLSHDPAKRITAQQLRHHPWLQGSINVSVTSSLTCLCERLISREMDQQDKGPSFGLRDPPNRLLEMRAASLEGDEVTSQYSHHSSSSGSIPDFKETAMYRFLFGAIENVPAAETQPLSAYEESVACSSLSKSREDSSLRESIQSPLPNLGGSWARKLGRSSSAPTCLQEMRDLQANDHFQPSSSHGCINTLERGSGSGTLDDWLACENPDQSSISKRAREILIVSSNNSNESIFGKSRDEEEILM